MAVYLYIIFHVQNINIIQLYNQLNFFGPSYSSSLDPFRPTDPLLFVLSGNTAVSEAKCRNSGGNTLRRSFLLIFVNVGSRFKHREKLTDYLLIGNSISLQPGVRVHILGTLMFIFRMCLHFNRKLAHFNLMAQMFAAVGRKKILIKAELKKKKGNSDIDLPPVCHSVDWVVAVILRWWLNFVIQCVCVSTCVCACVSTCVCVCV